MKFIKSFKVFLFLFGLVAGTGSRRTCSESSVLPVTRGPVASRPAPQAAEIYVRPPLVLGSASGNPRRCGPPEKASNPATRRGSNRSEHTRTRNEFECTTRYAKVASLEHRVYLFTKLAGKRRSRSNITNNLRVTWLCHLFRGGFGLLCWQCCLRPFDAPHLPDCEMKDQE